MSVIEIPLTRGYTALIDEADYERVGKMSWCAQVRKGAKADYVSAQASIRVSATRVDKRLMHRLIVDAKDGEQVDHINGNSLDNRRANLRLVSAAQNASNGKGRGRSGFRGVIVCGNAWRASIAPKGVEVVLGSYERPEDAAAAYNAAARVVYGEYARINDVPDKPGTLDAIIDIKLRAIERLQNEVQILRG